MMFIISHMELKPISRSRSSLSVHPIPRACSDFLGDHLSGTYMEPKSHKIAKKDDKVVSESKAHGHATSTAQDAQVKSNANGSLKERKVNGHVNGTGLKEM